MKREQFFRLSFFGLRSVYDGSQASGKANALMEIESLNTF